MFLISHRPASCLQLKQMITRTQFAVPQIWDASASFPFSSSGAWFSGIRIWRTPGVPWALKLGYTLVNPVQPRSVHRHLTLIFLLWFPCPLWLFFFFFSTSNCFFLPDSCVSPLTGTPTLAVVFFLLLSYKSPQQRSQKLEVYSTAKQSGSETLVVSTSNEKLVTSIL